MANELNLINKLAPSAVRGIDDQMSSQFGILAEKLIYREMRANEFYETGKYYTVKEVFTDLFGKIDYEAFMKLNNISNVPKSMLENFPMVLKQSGIRNQYPDFILHRRKEKYYLEFKADSNSGIDKGQRKLRMLSKVCNKIGFPYKPGIKYLPANIPIAYMANVGFMQAGQELGVALTTRLLQPGLVVYRVGINSNQNIHKDILEGVLKHVILESNKQHKIHKPFRLIDITSFLAPADELAKFAKEKFGIRIASAQDKTVGWKYFWKAIGERYLRSNYFNTDITYSLTVVQMLTMGLSIFNIFDIIEKYGKIWHEASELRKKELA